MRGGEEGVAEKGRGLSESRWGRGLRGTSGGGLGAGPGGGSRVSWGVRGAAVSLSHTPTPSCVDRDPRVAGSLKCLHTSLWRRRRVPLWSMSTQGQRLPRWAHRMAGP